MCSKDYSTQFVCVYVYTVSVCYLANSYTVNVQVQSKIRIESKYSAEGF